MLVGLKADLKMTTKASETIAGNELNSPNSLHPTKGTAESSTLLARNSPPKMELASPIVRTDNEIPAAPNPCATIGRDSTFPPRRSWEKVPPECEAIERVKRDLGAVSYIECSSLKQVNLGFEQFILERLNNNGISSWNSCAVQVGVERVFNEAVLAAIANV